MFTSPVPKKVEVWTPTGKPLASETYSKVTRLVETWTKLKMFTAPASSASDIGEADVVIVDDNNDNMVLSQ